MRSPHPTSAILPIAILALTTAGFVGMAGAQVTTSTTHTTSTTVGGGTTTSTTSSSTTTTVSAALRCKNRLLNRATKLARRLTRCTVRSVKRAKKSKPFDEAACVARGIERYDRTTIGSSRFPTGCIECTVDAAAPVRDGLVALAADLDARIACAPEVPIAERATCEIKVRKAVGGFQASIMACRKEAALLAFEGGAPTETACVATARARFDAKVARLTCPACVDGSRIGGTTFEETDDLVTVAQCPCRFGAPGACSQCRECDVSEGCIAADEGQACGRNGCTAQRCVQGTCTLGETVGCSDGDVCTVDVCVEDEDPSCQGAACCTHEPLCDPDTLDPCVTECSCEPTTGCACRCEPGCDYPGCVIFSVP